MSEKNRQYKIDTALNDPQALEEKRNSLFPAITYIYYPNTNRVKYLDNKIRDILGYDHHETSLSEFFNFIEKEDHEKVRTELKNIGNLRDKECRSYQCRIKHRDNNERIFQTTGTVLSRNKDGNASSILLVAYDITDLTGIGESAGQTIQKDKIIALERSNRELEEFAYAAAHDLQEPLRKIYTFSERLKEKLQNTHDKEVNYFLERIFVTTTNMTTLIDSLLDFSKIAHSEPYFEATNLNLILEEAKAETDEKTPDRHIYFSNDKLPAVDVIRAEIRHLFINLFSNAIKFQRPDTDPVISIKHEYLSSDEKSRLKLHKSIRYIKIIVQDNGIGFEPEFAEKIFQPFIRLHSKAEFPGSGIGLAICRKIVEHHRGLIYAESSPGSGATFTIIIPERQLRPV